MSHGLIRNPYALPFETWRQIFRFATQVDGVFDTSLKGPFDLEWATSSRTLRSRCRDAMAVKTNVVLVCRVWRDLATEFIFEIVFLTDRQLRSPHFVEILGSPRSRKSPFCHTHRLELCLKGPIAAPALFDPANIAFALPIILRQCTGLRIYIHNVAPMVQPKVSLNRILSSMGRSLRYLDIMGQFYHSEFDDLIEVMHSFPNLEHLRFDPDCSSTRPEETQIRSPKLHTFIAPKAFIAFDFQHSPLLQQINLPNLSPRHVDQLIPTWPASLRLLDLRACELHWTQVIFDSCPNLEELIISSEDHQGWLRLNGTWPKFKKFGVEIRWELDRHEELVRYLARLRETLRNVTIFPSLQLIRIATPKHRWNQTTIRENWNAAPKSRHDILEIVTIEDDSS